MHSFQFEYFFTFKFFLGTSHDWNRNFEGDKSSYEEEKSDIIKKENPFLDYNPNEQSFPGDKFKKNKGPNPDNSGILNRQSSIRSNNRVFIKLIL